MATVYPEPEWSEQDVRHERRANSLQALGFAKPVLRAKKNERRHTRIDR